MSLPQNKSCIKNVGDNLFRLPDNERSRERLFDGGDQLLFTLLGGERGGILTRKQQQQTAANFRQIFAQARASLRLSYAA